MASSLDIPSPANVPERRGPITDPEVAEWQHDLEALRGMDVTNGHDLFTPDNPLFSMLAGRADKLLIAQSDARINLWCNSNLSPLLDKVLYDEMVRGEAGQQYLEELIAVKESSAAIMHAALKTATTTTLEYWGGYETDMCEVGFTAPRPFLLPEAFNRRGQSLYTILGAAVKIPAANQLSEEVRLLVKAANGSGESALTVKSVERLVGNGLLLNQPLTQDLAGSILGKLAGDQIDHGRFAIKVGLVLPGLPAACDAQEEPSTSRTNLERFDFSTDLRYMLPADLRKDGSGLSTDQVAAITQTIKQQGAVTRALAPEIGQLDTEEEMRAATYHICADALGRAGIFNHGQESLRKAARMAHNIGMLMAGVMRNPTPSVR